MQVIFALLAILIVIVFFVGIAVVIVRSQSDLVTPNKEKGSAEYAGTLQQQDLRPPILLGYSGEESTEKSRLPSSWIDVQLRTLADSLDEQPQHDNRKSSDSILRYTGESHLLTVGSTRSGKGVGAIIPNLLRYEGSILVIDPKGENVAATAHARKALGHRIVVIDPWNVTSWPSASYNPLLVNAGNENTIIEDARLIAEALVVSSLDVSQLFFEEEARSVLSTIIAHLLTSDAPDETLFALRKITGQTDGEVKQFMRNLVGKPELDGFIARGASRFVDKTPNEYSGVLSTVRQHTEFLDSPAMRKALSSSDLRLRSMREMPITVYLVIPVWRLPTYNRWLRLMLTMALTELAQSSTTKNVPVLMIVDEFASLGLLPSFDTAFALMAGLGVQLWPIIQDFTQLKRMYGDSWETFVANAGVLQCFGTRDLLTASYISSRMGPTTIVVHERSESTGDNTRHGRLEQRALRYPDEVIKLDSNYGIAFVENSQPLLFRKIKYYQDARFVVRSVSN